MSRSAISRAKAAPRSLLPLARRMAVREHSRWIAARMITSGSGTRSAVSMMADMKLMRCSGSCLCRRQREELAGAGLVVAIALAARAQHLRFQRRDAGDVDEDPVHE